ncbi:chorismate-binding protein [Longispora sp. NPDC051575]|uniref:chorismate-binding protein n=1 Tax=Longispora sp. NPDC051575 TaxID=3154943 RepID=UPI0034209CA6
MTIRLSLTAPPVTPRNCQGTVRVRDRLEWRVGDPGDPAALAEEFLTLHRMPAADLSLLPGGSCPGGPTGSLCGAAVLLSGAGGAAAIGAPTGAPSPAPAVPDLAVVVYEHCPPVAPEEPGGWRLGAWAPSWSTRQHAEAVASVRAAIGRGDVYQVNVVGHWSASYVGDPSAALARVAAIEGAVYGGVLSGDGWAVACASPETLVSVAAGRVESRPIKGTRPATEQGRRELLASAKERAEHIMIVDLVRNDLALVARTGSVRVEELFALRRWVGLWQAESVVAAELAGGVGLAGLLRAVAPGGSVTGAPKRAALAQVARLERVGRGPSMGAVGFVSPYRLDLGLTIRTVAADAGRVHVWAGGGITWGSEPAAEVAEAAAKAGPIFGALRG